MLSFRDWLMGENFNVDDVLRMFDYQDSYKNLYPGWPHDDNNSYETDYYFPNQQAARQAAQEILDIFAALPDPIPVFRAIWASRPEDIDTTYGESWSFSRDAALEFGIHARANFLLSGRVAKRDVDWKSTLRLYVANSYARLGDQEDEIVVPNPEKIINFTVEPIRGRT